MAFQTLNHLSQLEVNNAKVGMNADGGGLYLQVTKTALGRLNKSWLYRYTIGGRERQMGLGSLTDARDKRPPIAGSSGSKESIQSRRESALGGRPREAR